MNDRATLNILSHKVKQIIGTNPMIKLEIETLLDAICERNDEKITDMLVEVMASVFSVTVKETIVYIQSEEEFDKLLQESQEEKINQQMAELEKEIFNG